MIAIFNNSTKFGKSYDNGCIGIVEENVQWFMLMMSETKIDVNFESVEQKQKIVTCRTTQDYFPLL